VPTVAVNPPKTPVTKGSSGVAAATIPNVCKMPGPPAPFVPTPLPNIGQSSKSPDGYSTSVKIEGQPVAIQGASFGSSGDIASKGTGGGIVSSNAEGPTKFIGPGSFDVKIEGKNVQLLGDQMLNNCGPAGSPANAATMMGLIQAPGTVLSAAYVAKRAKLDAFMETDKKPGSTEGDGTTAAALDKEVADACQREMALSKGKVQPLQRLQEAGRRLRSRGKEWPAQQGGGVRLEERHDRRVRPERRRGHARRCCRPFTSVANVIR
jgi:uncharacterized Zn-binding protein involved in type VI secretion